MQRARRFGALFFFFTARLLSLAAVLKYFFAFPPHQIQSSDFSILVRFPYQNNNQQSLTTILSRYIMIWLEENQLESENYR
jgi:hypothetical protein